MKALSLAGLALLALSCGPTKTHVTTKSSGYALATAVSAPKGEGGDANALPVVKPGKMTVNNQLVSASTGAALSENYVKGEASVLNLYVTTFETSDVDDFYTKKVVWFQPWSKTMTFTIPDTLSNQKGTLFVTLTRMNKATNEEEIINQVPLEFFVDASGLTISWVSKAQFVPAAQNAPIVLKVKLQGEGAPLASAPTAEASANGTDWTALPLSDWTEIGDEVYQFTILYPHATEKPFRVRVKAKDVLGNESVSAMSPNLVGRAGLSLAVPDAERSACKDGAGKAASNLQLHLASTVLCRAVAEDGSLKAERRAVLLAQNRGSVPLTFSDPEVNLISSMVDYLSLGGNQALSDQRFRNFAITPFTAPGFVQEPITLGYVLEQNRWAEASQILITFDRTEAGFHSTSDAVAQGNTCYPSAKPFPTVEIQNKASGLVLQDSDLPCDF